MDVRGVTRIDGGGPYTADGHEPVRRCVRPSELEDGTRGAGGGNGSAKTMLVVERADTCRWRSSETCEVEELDEAYPSFRGMSFPNITPEERLEGRRGETAGRGLCPPMLEGVDSCSAESVSELVCSSVGRSRRMSSRSESLSYTVLFSVTSKTGDVMLGRWATRR
jgi:hypothetical protein